MFDPPLILEGVYSFMLYNNFHSKMQKKNSTCVSTGKKAQIAWKILQTCLSAHFSNYALPLYAIFQYPKNREM